MALMNAQGVTKAASVDSSQQWRTQVAFVSSSPGGASPLVEALQGGYVTMASSMPAFARLRDSEVRMPLMTFAATDGPSAD